MDELNNTESNTSAGQNNTDDVLVIDSLTKKFGKFTAVDNISLEVKQGEIFSGQPTCRLDWCAIRNLNLGSLLQHVKLDQINVHVYAT